MGLRPGVAILGLLLLACTVSCQRAEDGRPVVFAAASLAEALSAVADGVVANGGPRPVFSFDATSRLARQVVQGAPADAFISADVAWMDEVERAGLVQKNTRVDLLGNRLVIAVPKGVTPPANLATLRASPPERLAVAGENVPAGRYADAALKATGLASVFESRLVRGHSVRTVLEWLARGDVPMAVVYASDAVAEPRVQVAFELPSSSHPPIVYVAAAIAREGADARRGVAARALLHFCASAEGMALFREAGFVPLQAPAAEAAP